jgi:dTDP-4-dehydrorhamnose 3,5-epimerase-like enzyme
MVSLPLRRLEAVARAKAMKLSRFTIPANDSDLKIDWQLRAPPIVSEKDKRGVPFRRAEVFD